jgi:hypothetical protein
MLRGRGLPHPHCCMVTFVALLQQVLRALRADGSCVAMWQGGGDTARPGGVLVVAHPRPPSHACTLPLMRTPSSHACAPSCPPTLSHPHPPSCALPPPLLEPFPTCVVHRRGVVLGLQWRCWDTPAAWC